MSLVRLVLTHQCLAELMEIQHSEFHLLLLPFVLATLKVCLSPLHSVVLNLLGHFVLVEYLFSLNLQN